MWDELARLVTDSDENVNNRHDVAVDLNGRLGHPAFWGSGDARLPPRRPLARPLPELRVVERELRRRGAHPKAVWQLSYAGSVGSQTLLLGIPRVRALRDDPELAWRSAVWPFETDFALPEETRIVHAEIYPTIGEALRPLHAVRDAHQVLSTVELWRDLDRAGELGRLFADPSGIEPSEKAAAAREEGWILGAPLVPDGDWRRARPRVYAAVW